MGRVTPRFLNLLEATFREELNSALLAHFCPRKPLPLVPTILRPHQDYQPLMADEITAALRK